MKFGRKFISNKTNKTLIDNTGFGENVDHEGSRLILKNGQFNIRKTGLSFYERFSLFHWLTHLTWLKFFGFMLLMYLVLNSMFAFCFYLLGSAALDGYMVNSSWEQFMKSFYFSAQTLTTVGYGSISPLGWQANVLATVESFFGLMSFAFATGILYGRFSRPKAKMRFSDYALFSPYKEDGMGLMIRLANATNSQMIRVSAKLMMSWIEEEGEEQIRRFFNLHLEMDNISMLASSWTLVHPVDKESPFDGITMEDMQRRNMELILQLHAYDETYARDIHVQTSYKHNEVIWNAKFKRVLGQDEEGRAVVELSGISDFVRLDER